MTGTTPQADTQMSELSTASKVAISGVGLIVIGVLLTVLGIAWPLSEGERLRDENL